MARPVAIPAGLPASFVPSFFSERDARSLVRALQRALSSGVVVVGSGRVRAGELAGCPCWAVSSSSRPGLCRLVVLSGGRLQCSCPAGRAGQRFCLHRACVRLRLLAQLPAPAPRASFVGMHVPPPPGESGGAMCPTCRMPAQWREVEELGECLRCLYARSSEPQPVPAPQPAPPPAPAVCPLCGEPSPAAGLYCEVCRTARARYIREQAAAIQRRITAEALMAREEQRQRMLRQHPGLHRQLRAEQAEAQDTQIAAESAESAQLVAVAA